MIYLVGSGPGDPGLFTIKGAECMRAADAVVYDRLAPEVLLSHAPAGAERIYVGKKPGAPTMPQEEINATLVRLGKEGKTVVRLKGGDPYVFGRGGEEALALLEAGLPFEVVPGVTSGIAAPAYAGIPVTHRHVSTSVAFITGHEDPAKGTEDVDWEGVARGAETLVLYMGVGRLREISKRLISAGRPPETPVACVRWGTRPEQETVVASLGTIADEIERVKLKPPAITVIGDVVSLREDGLDWYERRPLFGKRVVVTRARAQAGELSRELESLGAEVLEFPTIKIQPPGDFGPLDEAVRDLDSFGWIVFTSANGVAAFVERLGHHGLDLRAVPRDAKLAAIGPATADAVREAGLRVDVVPEEYRAEALLEALLDGSQKAGGKVLIPRAKVAREVLPEKLREAGMEVVVPPAYETVPSGEGKDDLGEKLVSGGVDCVTFTASSTVDSFVGAFGEEAGELLSNTRVACIGPITAETARGYGIRVDVEATEYTIPGLVKAVVGAFAEPQQETAVSAKKDG